MTRYKLANRAVTITAMADQRTMRVMPPTLGSLATLARHPHDVSGHPTGLRGLQPGRCLDVRRNERDLVWHENGSRRERGRTERTNEHPLDHHRSHRGRAVAHRWIRAVAELPPVGRHRARGDRADHLAGSDDLGSSRGL